jgi:hypothetical protein
MLTIGQAARSIGRSKSTVWRAIKSGQLSATRNADGTVAIDPAELSRLYPETPANGSGNVSLKPNGTGSDTALERENALLRETIADLRADRDAWRAQAERLLLTSSIRSELPAQRRRWWWPIRSNGQR